MNNNYNGQSNDFNNQNFNTGNGNPNLQPVQDPINNVNPMPNVNNQGEAPAQTNDLNNPTISQPALPQNYANMTQQNDAPKKSKNKILL